MSSGSRIRSKEKRKSIKAANKATKRALYESWSADGRNSKSKHSLKNNKNFVKSYPHVITKCGNIGCKNCFPRFNEKKIL